MKIYLDMNVYNKVLKEVELYNSLNVDGYMYYYSGAHAEEVHLARVNSNGKNNVDISNRIALIQLLTKNNKIVPTINDGFVVMEESFDDCIRRVETDDTVEAIKNKATSRLEESKKHIEAMRVDNDASKHFSSLDSKEIWKENEVRNLLDEFNSIMPLFTRNYNNSDENRVVNNKYGFRSVVREDLKIDRVFLRDANLNHHEFELVIEILIIILDLVGYRIDKELKRYNSSIHDLSHIINASYCDFFVTMDKKLIARANAIYHYLGISTKAVEFYDFIGQE